MKKTFKRMFITFAVLSWLYNFHRAMQQVERELQAEGAVHNHYHTFGQEDTIQKLKQFL